MSFLSTMFAVAAGCVIAFAVLVVSIFIVLPLLVGSMPESGFHAGILRGAASSAAVPLSWLARDARDGKNLN